MIDFLIAHEAPAIELLPDSEAQRWRTFVNEVYTKNQFAGWQAAQTEFMAALINVPDTPYPPDLNERISGNVDFFFKRKCNRLIRNQDKTVQRIEDLEPKSIQRIKI